MSFRFHVTEVHDLPKAGKVVLDGFFVTGTAITRQRARVAACGNTPSFPIEGVVLSGYSKRNSDKVSLTVSRKEALAANIQAGQDIVSVDWWRRAIPSRQ